jgi:predicted nuclease of predicted toxin-antitoxin system
LRLFIDECLSPRLAERLNATGEHDAIHPLHVGRRGERDDTILARCIREDRVIVTENGEDFRGLVARADIHPGLIVLPALPREETYSLLLRALEFLATRGEVPAYAGMDAMVNHVLDVDRDGACRLYPLPPTAS